MMLIDRIEVLFNRHGRKLHDGLSAEPVTALAHALQCAQLAEQAGADLSMVAAALLHDVGHFLHAPRSADEDDDAHELCAIPLLAPVFGPAVTEPIRWHVQAKRYLVAVDPAYLRALTPASTHALALQGGAMTAEECRSFEALPFATQALQLRRWDDLSKDPGKPVPPLAHYLAAIRPLAGPADAPRLLSDALDSVV
jgi:phosphonate degradation associated HDIG domain protein